MSTGQKIGLAIVGVAMATTILLPGRQTVPAITATSRLFTGSLSTAEGTSAGAVG